MDGLASGNQGNDRGSPHGRAVLLVLLPAVFLGAAYFLFAEYVLRDAVPAGSPIWLTLRIGGAGLILLALILAAAAGYLVVDRMMRPLRLLLRLAETGEINPGRAPWLQARSREYHDLYRLLSVLVSQNKSGARAMEELDQLRISLAHFREEIARTGQHGIVPDVQAAGPLTEVGVHLRTKRKHLLAFFADLRERVRRASEELDELGRTLGMEPPGRAAAPPLEVAPASGALAVPEATRSGAAEEASGGAAPAAGEPLEAGLERVTASVQRLRQLGTVAALETARAGAGSGRRASELLERFGQGLADLESVVRAVAVAARNGDLRARTAAAATSAAAEEMRAACRLPWSRLRETLESVERRLAEVEER